MENKLKTIALLFIISVVLLISYVLLQENERRRLDDLDVTSPLPDISVASNVVCSSSDVNNDNRFTLVDFAAFAKKYGSECSSRKDSTQTNGSKRVNIELRAKDVPQNMNAVNFDLEVQNAKVINLKLVEKEDNWLPRIGTCNSNKKTFTQTRICFSAAKNDSLQEGELLATVLLEFENENEAILTMTEDNYYSEGSNRTTVTGELRRVASPLVISGGCGNQDVNNDNVIDLIDFANFARRYGLESCGTPLFDETN